VTIFASKGGKSPRVSFFCLAIEVGGCLTFLFRFRRCQPSLLPRSSPHLLVSAHRFFLHILCKVKCTSWLFNLASFISLASTQSLPF
jgi:hypothetical protein